jgi:hypothetical protein
MVAIIPIIKTKQGAMEVLGYCYMGQSYTVRTLDGKRVMHIPASEVLEEETEEKE